MKRALLLLLLAACDPADFVVAHQPDGGDFTPNPCNDNSGCHENEFCEKHDCGDPHGECHVRPFCMGMDQFQPVCGCNGITYWNECLRKLDGAQANRETIACTAAKSCNTAGDCSPGHFASCARVSELSCPTNGATGSCWALPPQCPPGQAMNAQSCSGGACMDLCGAIRSELPALLQSSCP